MQWIGWLLGCAVALLVPIYRHTQSTHQLICNAKFNGTWKLLPKYVSSKEHIIDTLQGYSRQLSIKIKTDGRHVKACSKDPANLYTLLRLTNDIPNIGITGLVLKHDKNTMILTFDITGSFGNANNALPKKAQKTFYQPRFYYVNATTTINGQTKTWVNDQLWSGKPPCALYHTFDKKTGQTHKGDARPKFSGGPSSRA